ncbi:short-chain dehydrogenases/reductase, putative [Talaromyces stipitatus ATCC 10500]|uniref:Short-chain dehydrogenases/reductase, putative n=1 Tax=Talaromyces stipitatus (strain ATCC 10500 / CBS 375.48 / QM 6759 / NRRL 1006) TaxID=441959 RepID=B8ME27_TALSN|nr:short-chain dehydrogenases/reductase, putative [Talaromyces stipitatus ATCC 10500]EED16104.1 short-chain dehydrogenases/reductase, putative [Talaromyces stipitatus ATCC 10500]
MPSYLITGTSRGLGLAFTTELLKNPENLVIATARNTGKSTGLQNLKAQYPGNDRLILVDMDVASLDSIRAAVKAVEPLLPNGLDNLVSNAGVSYAGMQSFEQLDVEKFTSEVDFTITAPLNLLREFLPLIRKGQAKRALFVTSVIGSIELAAHMPGLLNAYAVARAALNMLVRKWSSTLKGEGITAALIHPGWVGETDIGDELSDWVAKYNPSLENVPSAKSAADCMKVLNNITPEDSGVFFNHDGSKLPW